MVPGQTGRQGARGDCCCWGSVGDGCRYGVGDGGVECLVFRGGFWGGGRDKEEEFAGEDGGVDGEVSED